MEVPTTGMATDQESSASTGPTPEPTAQPPTPEQSARRGLAPEQQGEVVRLYTEGNLPTSEIRKRFGMGESSLYRILARHGVPLRGRTAVPERPTSSRAQAPRRGGGRSSAGRGAQIPIPRPRGRAAPATIAPRPDQWTWSAALKRSPLVGLTRA